MIYALLYQAVLNANKLLNLCSDVNVNFRNYLPHYKQLQEGKLDPLELPKFEDPVAAEPPKEVGWVF